MNKFYVFILVFGLILNGCKKDTQVYHASDLLEQLQNHETQVYQFRFVSDTLIKTKNGNTIYLVKDDFIEKNTDTITIEINEYYEKSDLILNNIRTLTDNGTLLESKGVFKVDIYSNNKPLKLKTGREIKMDLVSQDYKDNHVYVAEIDSMNQFTWKEESPIMQFITLNYKYGAVERLVSIDSLDYYNNLSTLNLSEDVNSQITNVSIELNPIHSVFFTNSTYVNLDKILVNPIKKDFNFEIKSDSFDNHFLYFIYDNVNSFSSYSLWEENLELSDVPIFNGTKLIFVSFNSYNGDNILYDELIINENTDSNISINLKEGDIDQLKKVLTKK